MQFNLIDEKWIPIKRRDGKEEMVAPWEVTDRFAENPVVALNAPRPDFNGALIQFLIGLVQTVAAPDNRVEWKIKLNKPPEPEELKTKFATVRHAFELGGDGPRFMQDFNDFDKEFKPIGWLLIGGATENTINENTDHFIKRNNISGLCPHCCIAALITMQTNSPSGGQGYRTSLRGGGPLTTLILGDNSFDTLWHTIWLNIIELPNFASLCNSNQNKDFNKFPWLAATKLQATEQDINPAQYFWAMPRRIKLNLDSRKKGLCDICSEKTDNLITQYKETNRGTKYQAPMKHPLSPYNRETKKAVLTRPGGVCYRHWLGYIFNDAQGSCEPAKVVHEYINERQNPSWQLRLWAFGYDMKNMKARCWYDSVIPLITVNSESVKNYENEIANLIRTADIISTNIKIAIKRAIHGRPQFDPLTKKIKWKYKDIKKISSDEQDERKKVLYSIKDQSVFMASDVFFWQNTEKAFYEALYSLKKVFEVKEDSVADVYTKWLDTLSKASLDIFEHNVSRGPVEDTDPKRVVLARNEMEKFNRGNKIKELLGLPVEQKSKGKEKKQKTRKEVL